MEFNFKRTHINDGVAFYDSLDTYDVWRKSDEGYRIESITVRIATKFLSDEPFSLNTIFKFKTEVNIDFKVVIFKINSDGEMIACNGRGMYKKVFEMNYRIVSAIRNIEGAINEHIRKENISISDENFAVSFDDSKKYISIVELNNSVLKLLEENRNNEVDEIIKNIATKKELKGFYDEMKEAIELEVLEPKFESILKKHQKLLPLVIPSIDLMKKFQYHIEEDGMDENSIDGYAVDVDNIPNLIELKKSSTILLDKSRTYRNNTYRPTVEFSGAIQQANIQRIHYILGAKKP